MGPRKILEEVISVVDDSPDVKKKKPGPAPKKTKATDKPDTKDITPKKSARATVKKVTPKKAPVGVTTEEGRKVRDLLPRERPLHHWKPPRKKKCRVLSTIQSTRTRIATTVIVLRVLPREAVRNSKPRDQRENDAQEVRDHHSAGVAPTQKLELVRREKKQSFYL